MHNKSLIFIFILCCILAIASTAMSKVPLPVADKSLDFSLSDLNGVTHKLSEYKGKKVFLNFWASWCPPCRSEMPAMQKMYTSWDKTKYVMLAVNIGESKEQVSSFMKKNNYTFPVLLDRDQRVASQFQVRGIPATFIINRQGKVVGREVGAREWNIELFDRF